MPRSASLVVYTICLAALAALPACGIVPQGSDSTEDSRGFAGSEGAGATGPSPENERSIRRKQEFAEATRGLTFQDGRVLVEPNDQNDPNLALAHIRHGDELLSLNRSLEAVIAYVLAVRTKPDLTEAYVRLGWALHTKKKDEDKKADGGDWQKAVDKLAGAIGYRLSQDHAMPANNRLLVWRR